MVSGTLEAVSAGGQPTAVEVYRKYMPTFRVTTIAGVGHLGIVWERIEEFDTALIDAIGRFVR